MVAHIRKPNEGQILIVVLFVMLIGLTVGIFTVRRTLTDVTSSESIEESAKAFNAAEAGVEDAIRSTSGIVQNSPVPFASGIYYSVGYQDLANSTTIFPDSLEKQTEIGDIFTVWLVPHDESTGDLIEDDTQSYQQNTMEVCFTSATPAPALSVTLMFRQGVLYRSSYAGYDPVSSRISTNNLLPTTAVTSCGGSNPYTFQAHIDFLSDFGVDLSSTNVIPLAVRIRPLYAATSIAVVPVGGVGGSLPKQGNQIASTGNSGEFSRKIEVNKYYKIVAPFLDDAVYTTSTTQDIGK